MNDRGSEVARVEHEPVPDIVVLQPFQRGHHLCRRQHLDVGHDAVKATEIEQLLGVAASAAAGRAETLASHQQVHGLEGDGSEVTEPTQGRLLSVTQIRLRNRPSR